MKERRGKKEREIKEKETLKSLTYDNVNGNIPVNRKKPIFNDYIIHMYTSFAVLN